MNERDGGDDGVRPSGQCCWKTSRLLGRWPVQDVPAPAAAAAPRPIMILPRQPLKRWPHWLSFLGGSVGLAVTFARAESRGAFEVRQAKLGRHV